jgi:hypothetical protein
VQVGRAALELAHCAALRPSFQRIAGRSTSPAASSSTQPCICPDKADGTHRRQRRRVPGSEPQQRRVQGRPPLRRVLLAPERPGRDTVSGSRSTPSGWWSLPSSTAFSSEVPRSMPR